MSLPPRQGLYDPKHEHDSCGVGFVVNIKNRKSHDIIEKGLQILLNLDHRGAVGADPLAGDGVGILIQMPDAFLRAEMGQQRVSLPDLGAYACGMLFLPKDGKARAWVEGEIRRLIAAEGQILLGFRDVPVNREGIGETVLATEPVVRQVLIGRGPTTPDQNAFERKLYVIRRQIENAVATRVRAKDLPDIERAYIPSMSSRTLIYKGIFLGAQLRSYYPDLQDQRLVSALALVHQRFSTNTFPSWRLAHPYRMICHNGEINTLQGNVNWMAARRHSMKSPLFGADLDKLWPLIQPGQSDTACFDNALELLVQGGYSLAHAMMLMVPEAWAGNPLMGEKRRAFYEYHAAVMEPWDGPAALAFTDGRQIGATLDRNGLRPARYIITDDDHVIMSSEVGVLPIPDEKVVKKWRLQPGRMFLIDLEQGRIIEDAELKATLATAKPYREWLARTQIQLEDLPSPNVPPPVEPGSALLDRQQAFGYTQEDIDVFLEPMARDADDPIGSMGTDTPISALSRRAKLLYSYFKQRFAQVTNPPIDSIREELVMSLVSLIGPRPNLLGLADGGGHMRLETRQPVLTNEDLEKIRSIHGLVGASFKTLTLDMTWDAEEGEAGLAPALARLCRDAEKAVGDGYNILILSDRAVSSDRIPVPALLGTSAVHHHLIRKGLRTETGIVVETGECRETHHFATLAGYGAEAINPYLAFETLERLRVANGLDLPADKVQKNYIKAVDKALLKIMSKMGISTYQSYCGAQIFDAVGLAGDFVAEYFTGTSSAVEGIGLAEVARETVMRHRLAYGDSPVHRDALDVGGERAYRIRGEDHAWTPETIGTLQHAVRGNVADDYKTFARIINDQSERLLTLRGLFALKPGAKPVPLDQVEPAKEIVKRFATGAMSFGSISREAHTTLAIAMNRIGGKSNTGEGGEEADRFKPLPNGDSLRS
ncbi:MAG: glutamate synthase subunit alpha, partial [Alphaproteobacteria bacterium]|nr:glutamate synthase subunit alpha [Alphaproteobacteria bacterium]